MVSLCNLDKLYLKFRKDLVIKVAEDIVFYFREVGYLDEDMHYILTDPDALEKRALAGDEGAGGSGAKFTQGECILYHELKLEVFR